VTSPPYNLGIKYDAYDDRLPDDAYLEWMDDVAKALLRVLKDDGSLFLNVGASNKDPWIAADVAECFRRKFALQNEIVWVKSIVIDDVVHGHYKPVRSDRYLNNNFEAIYHFTKRGDVAIDRLAIGAPFADKSNIARRDHAEDKHCAGDTWFIPYETAQSKEDKFFHPAGFPVELAERCLKLHGLRPGLLALDPFLGAGSTLVAAARLGVDGVGMEIDPFYAKTAIERLASEIGEAA